MKSRKEQMKKKKKNKYAGSSTASGAFATVLPLVVRSLSFAAICSGDRGVITGVFEVGEEGDRGAESAASSAETSSTLIAASSTGFLAFFFLLFSDTSSPALSFFVSWNVLCALGASTDYKREREREKRKETRRNVISA